MLLTMGIVESLYQIGGRLETTFAKATSRRRVEELLKGEGICDE